MHQRGSAGGLTSPLLDPARPFIGEEQLHQTDSAARLAASLGQHAQRQLASRASGVNYNSQNQNEQQ